ncbi:chloride channel [Thelephora terrestris]|uniref:Chloride channel n=1 Tax=Thelephora terrestris TaxID=56493 RepID=A0A9P6LEA7_9AGAM|nr:chloride channel [Thelephora terrestris]
MQVPKPPPNPNTPEQPYGPLSGPSDPTWRRRRLMNIGGNQSLESNSNADERTPFSRYNSLPRNGSYGSIASPPNLSPTRSAFRSLRRFPSIGVRIPAIGTGPPSPQLSPSIRKSYFGGQRPISAYDAPLLPEGAVPDAGPGVRTNGIRVWYSSYSSIDWLHDTIKDSVRRFRLRKRTSFRGRLRSRIDKSVGWVIVTIVGFLTAVVAYMIVRSEQWLFDIKNGYCAIGWWKAERFCCPGFDDVALTTPYFVTSSPLEACEHWRTWGDVFAGKGDHTLEDDLLAYLAYAGIALMWATISCLLTIYLTASNSFMTRKDSGVLGPSFADADGGKETDAVQSPHKRQVMYYAAGSGIPEIKTILSGFVIHGYLGGRTLFTKSVGLALSVASGLSLGKEGPFVHIASCIGNIVSRFFVKYETNEGKRREILSAASAAGVAVAFGAPIGGVLFSLEEVSYFFPPKVMWRSFFCAMIAAMTLKFLDPFGTGKLVLFQVTYDKDWHAQELLFFLILGVFGGVYGAWFSRLNYRWSKEVRNTTWLKTHPVAEVVLVTVITTALAFINPYTKMGGTELVYKLFEECRPGNQSSLCVLDPSTQALPVIYALLVTLAVKAGLTVITFGTKLPAGIFIPTLGVGACAGRIMGILVRWMQANSDPDLGYFAFCRGDLNCVVSGLYAMVGAAAALSGVTRTTVSLAVIMFELTDTLTYAVPVMLSVLVAKAVADALEPKGIYDLVIDLNQLPYLDAKHVYLWGDNTVSDVTDLDVDTIRLDEENTVTSLRDQLMNLVSVEEDGGFPILRQDEGGMRMLGYIGANELEHALSIVADDGDAPVIFHTTSAYGHGMYATPSVSSFTEEETANGGAVRNNPFDFSIYMDGAPLTVQDNSPLELVQEFFTKLGARYVVVTDTDGYYEGVIDKKAWLGFLRTLGEKR